MPEKTEKEDKGAGKGFGPKTNNVSTNFFQPAMKAASGKAEEANDRQEASANVPANASSQELLTRSQSWRWCHTKVDHVAVGWSENQF